MPSNICLAALLTSFQIRRRPTNLAPSFVPSSTHHTTLTSCFSSHNELNNFFVNCYYQEHLIGSRPISLWHNILPPWDAAGVTHTHTPTRRTMPREDVQAASNQLEVVDAAPQALHIPQQESSRSRKCMRHSKSTACPSNSSLAAASSTV